jgi:hypothetical protein
MPKPKKRKKVSRVRIQVVIKVWDYWLDNNKIYVLFEMKIGNDYQMFLTEESVRSK